MLIPFTELFPRHNIKATGVLHLGANFGQEAASYHAVGIKQVVWVEALPDVFAQLTRNIESRPWLQGAMRETAVRACVSDVDGKEVQFNVANNEGQSSSLLEFGTHSVEHPTVKFTSRLAMKTTRVDTLLAGRVDWGDRRWFLNIDLQGAELLALKGMEGLMPHFDYAYIEVNERELYKGCPLVGEIDEHLARFGFVGAETKMENFGWGDKLFKRA